MLIGDPVKFTQEISDRSVKTNGKQVEKLQLTVCQSYHWCFYVQRERLGRLKRITIYPYIINIGLYIYVDHYCIIAFEVSLFSPDAIESFFHPFC